MQTTITFEIQAKIYQSPVNINERRVTKSDAKNSDVFETKSSSKNRGALVTTIFEMQKWKNGTSAIPIVR